MSFVTTGWFRRPLSKRVSIRRSTVILVVAFVALFALYLAVRPKTVEDEQPSPAPVVTTAPAVDVPATDVQVTDVPATNTPATDTPATDVPATEVPATVGS